MRCAHLTTALAITLVAGPCAFAEDSATIPGGSRHNPGLQRPAAENPTMKPFMNAAPAPAARRRLRPRRRRPPPRRSGRPTWAMWISSRCARPKRTWRRGE